MAASAIAAANDAAAGVYEERDYLVQPGSTGSGVDPVRISKRRREARIKEQPVTQLINNN